jgi:two-component sensor histidine kinase
MALHELATNSSKHGVLASGRGEIAVRWGLTTEVNGDEAFFISWNETFGEPRTADKRYSDRGAGFGTIVLNRVAPQSLSGIAWFDAVDHGVRWELRAPVDHVVPESSR